MSLLSRNFGPLFAPADETPTPTAGSSGNAGGSNEMSREDMIDFLASDDDDEVISLEEQRGEKPKGKAKSETPQETPSDDEEIPEETGEETDDEEDDELEDLEQEIEGPTEEQLELVTPVRRREILKKYPNLFKDFPYLEKAYYREQQFTELLPTIEDAKTAVEKAQTLDRFESDVIQGGNIQNILKAVKEENPRAFYRIADNYLETLSQIDEKAYFHVLGNITKNTIIAMVQEAKTSNNDVLKSAAQILNQFVFGSSNFSPPTKLSSDKPGEDEKESEVNEREQQFMRQAFETTLNDLNTRINNTLRNTIETHIDPRKSMTDYVRRNASRDALDTLEQLISKDARFKSLTDKLWEKAIENNFSKDAVDKIKSAYLSKAKALLPGVIKKARNEALKGIGKRVRDEEESTTSEKKGPVTPGRPRSHTPSGKVKSAADIPRGMSTLEFLSQD